MRIRQTKRYDLIAQLDAAADPWDVWGSDEIARHTWWMAFADGKPAGHAAARVLPEGSVYLTWARVLRPFRGHGLQKRLIRARCAWGRRQGCGTAITYTARDNMPSINSLISCGFRPYEPEYAWVGRDWMYWQRRL